MLADIAEASTSLILESAANKMKAQFFIAVLPSFGFRESIMQNCAPVLL
jgi:hypothetical protein